MGVGGDLYCWGDREHGQSVVPLGYDVQVHAVALGAAHTCVVDEDAVVGCWGDDFYDQVHVPKVAQ